MNWLKFLMVDFRLIKKQLPIMMIFPAVVVLISASGTDMFFIMSYLCFGVLVFSTTPFMAEDKSMSSFVQLLPGRERDKVLGRFGLFLAMFVAVILFGLCLSFLFSRFGIGEIRIGQYDYYFSALTVFFGIIVGSLQMTAFYVFGRVKSQQILNIIRILPAFLFFFLSNYIVENMADELGEAGAPANVLSVMSHIVDNELMILLCGVSLSVIVFSVSIIVSTYRVSRRDVSGGSCM